MVAASSEDNLDDGCFSSILKISFSMIGGTESPRLGKSVILQVALVSFHDHKKAHVPSIPIGINPGW